MAALQGPPSGLCRAFVVPQKFNTKIIDADMQFGITL